MTKALRKTRNKDGLTPKMLALLPYIAVSETVRAGVDAYRKESGETADYHYICKNWSKDQNWLDALTEAQQQFEFQMRQRVNQRVIANLDKAAEALVQITESDRPDKARGAEDILTLGGYDVGKGTKVNVTNVQANGGKQASFAERVRAGATERFPDLIESAVDSTSGEDAE